MCSILPPRYHRNGRMHYDQKYPVLLLFSAYSIPIPQDLIEICYSPLIFFNKFNFLSRNFLGLLKSWDLIEIFLKPTLKPFEHHPPPSWTPPSPATRTNFSCSFERTDRLTHLVEPGQNLGILFMTVLLFITLFIIHTVVSLAFYCLIIHSVLRSFIAFYKVFRYFE